MAALKKPPTDLLNFFILQAQSVLTDNAAIEVGFSGGVDSTVLLNLLNRCRAHFPFQLSAVHVHHGLSAQADSWVKHCQSVCRDYAISLRIAHVQVLPQGGVSLEAAARGQRYQVYLSSQAKIIALAHHQDDQAETVLLQLLRGGGPRALAAMPSLRRCSQITLWRPLLNFQRASLEDYARQNKLSWINDDTNLDTHYRRNWLRHIWLPQCAHNVPDYRQHLQHSRLLMAQAVELIDEIAQADWTHCIEAARLQLPLFFALSAVRQRYVLLNWLEQLCCGSASYDAIEAFRLQLLHAPIDRHPELKLKTASLFRYRQQVWVDRTPSAQTPTAVQLSWPSQYYALPHWGGILQVHPQTQGLDPTLLQDGFELRVRHGGERLLTKMGHKAIKTLLQEAAIPPRLRSRWPLLYLPDGRLAALVSVAIADDCKVPEGVGFKWDIT